MTTLRTVAEGFAEVAALFPDAEVERNEVGNIVFLSATDYPLGYVNVRTGEWNCFDDADLPSGRFHHLEFG